MPMQWNKLRSWNGSQETAFEELICQLARFEPVPSGSLFIRKGTPDSGVECFWQTPKEIEFGWQAKFFVSPPNASQWKQVDASVRRALDGHKNLVEYTVCMAVDRADARRESSKSFLDRWNEHREKWEQWAATMDRSVKFSYWGTHELAERLSREVHRGRYYFWFEEEYLGPVWFERRIKETVASIGPKYSPGLNVQLPISDLFDGLSRSEGFFARFRRAYGNVGRAWSEGAFGELKRLAPDQMAILSQKLGRLTDDCKTHDRSGVDPIDLSHLESLIFDLLDEVKKSSDLLRAHSQRGKKADQNRMNEQSQARNTQNTYGYALNSLARLSYKIEELLTFVRSSEAHLANKPSLLVSGSAGAGKTHLLADAASRCISRGVPAVLLLGSQFDKGPVWERLLRILGLTCPPEDFLGALQSAAQLTGERAVIFIDALNEGDARTRWANELPAMLAILAHYPWIGIVVSVRDSYENIIIQEGLVPAKIIRTVHRGFVDFEYEATKTYFDFYGIELPTVPLLTPEFQNPLFLSCFCRGLHNRGLSRVPDGIRGLTSIFQFFLSSIDLKLSRPEYLDYDEKSKKTECAVKLIAHLMSERTTQAISRQDAQEVCESVLPNAGHDRSLFRHLISEGILTETVKYDKPDGYHEVITFAYERFGDHYVMHELLSPYTESGASGEDFKQGPEVSQYFANEELCRRNRGLLDALAVQGPELFDMEVFEMISTPTVGSGVGEAFVESLLWRKASTIKRKSLDYINKHIITNDSLNHMLMNTLLTVAPNPDHPFNADFLHRNLMDRQMANRDESWSIYLSDEYGTSGTVDRIIDWAWSAKADRKVSGKSALLLGRTLIWFLTTSHRFLRDRATKALVSILQDRFDALCELLRDFSEVNDPYVAERVYAVAYGCALRSTSKIDNQTLGQLVYDLIFKDGNPPCDILLRDYARGVVEVAIRDGLNLTIRQKEKVVPPYRSSWPLEIPAKKDVEKYGEWIHGMSQEQWSLHSIYESVMGSGDFARYILGSDHGNLHWSNRQLGEPRVRSNKEKYDAFEASLTDRQRKAWESLLAVRMNAEIYRRLDLALRTEAYGDQVTNDDLKKVVEEAERRLRNTLGKAKSSCLDKVILPYLASSASEKDEFALPVNIAQRWIMQNVMDRGWSVDRFGRFDRRAAVYADSGRSADKPERIGKKYQWIAYHELLAHLADNLEFRENVHTDTQGLYAGPWQMWLRDIDPSCLVRSTSRNRWEPSKVTWWAPVEFTDWMTEPDDVQWLRRTDLLPEIDKLPIVEDPKNGSEWFVLECLYNWEQPTEMEDERFRVPRRYIWYMLKSYLVRAEDENAFFVWAQDQQFMGRWMPESNEQTRIFLGEFFWSQAFQYFDSPYFNHDGWTKGQGHTRLPCEVLVTSDQYMQERGNYDCSIDDTISMYLPAKWIAEQMGLCWRGVEGCYFDRSGDLMTQDPSVGSAGPSALLVNKERMSEFLRAKGYRIVWTLLGEKDIRAGMHSTSENWPGRMEISGCLRLKNSSIDGRATARWVSVGPTYETIGDISLSPR